jgi:O2-independent ubiquinone biosynthesis protein UbiV
MTMPETTLTLGPVLYLWESQMWRDFYFRIADEADVDRVVLGEIVCSKREHFHEEMLEEVAERLRAAGKQVAFATLALVTAERELKSMRRLAASGALIEASELTAHAAMAGRPHAIGPLVNVYNAPTARVLAKGGATSICLPPELPLSSVSAIAADACEVAIEVFAFGKIPLAISARCAHARIRGNVKDNCQFVCREDPDGLQVNTLDGERFLALNGVQTMSSSVQCLAADVDALRAVGVKSLRLSPQVCDMVAVAATFRSRAAGRIGAAEALASLRAIYEGAEFASGFIRGLPGHALVGFGA